MFWSAFAAMLLGSSMGLTSSPAEAQSYKQQQSRPAKPPLFTPLPNYVDGPMLAIVSIKSQRLYLFGKNGLIASSAVSTGVKGHETPEGVFSIIQKEEDHRSNIYDDAAMPFMHRITWSGVALHAGVLPGYPASHGCIRLPHAFVENLFKISKLGMRVVITPTDTAPMSFSHASLFQPRLTYVGGDGKAEAAPSPDQNPADGNRPALKTEDGEQLMMLGGRLPKPDGVAARTQKTVLTPVEAANARKVELARLAADATKAADSARLAARTKVIDGQKHDKTARMALARQKQTEQRLVWAEKVVATAKTDDQRQKAEVARAKLVEELATLTAAANEAKDAAGKSLVEAKQAQDSIKDLEAAKTKALAEAKKASRLDNPVTVFVSLANKRVYIRQAREEVADMPIAIKSPEKPIGTHVFTAIDATDGGRKMSWNVVNVASPTQPPRPPVLTKVKGKIVEQPAPAAELPMPDEQAKAALDRIEFPQEVVDRVAPYLQVGSTLIVSDLPPSFETGPGTDIIVQTKGEEEARESVRRFVAEQRGERSERRRSRDRDYDERPRRSYSSSGWSWFD